MKKLKIILISSILVLGIGVLTYKTASPQSNKIVTEKKSLVDVQFNAMLDKELSTQYDFHQCPGMAIAVIQGDEVVFEQLYGSKSAYSQIDIDENSIFRIGSVSKGFAGMMAAILIDKGLISLEDSLCSYIPELSVRARSKDHILRVKHILSHSTGFTEHAFSNLVDENHSMETLIANINRLTPRDSTGKAYAYQNAAFGLIERVIEKATGMPYAQALKMHIFDPLGMSHSSADFASITSAQNVCYGHKYGGQRAGFVQIPLSPHYYNVASAGGVNASLRDMKTWLKALMGNPSALTPRALDIAFTPQVNTSDDDKYFNRWPGSISSHYALGWRLVNTAQGDYVYHGGLVNGFRCEIAFDRKKKVGIVVMFNSTCSYSNLVVPHFFNVWHHYHATPSKGVNIS
jgi:beta-lactamase class C